MKQLKEFMLLFRYEPSNEQLTQEQLEEMQKHWGEFIGEIGMKQQLVSTNQLGFEGKQVFSDFSIVDGIHIDKSQILGGNMIVKAESIDVAVELTKNCPILKMGGSVEVRAIIPMIL